MSAADRDPAVYARILEEARRRGFFRIGLPAPFGDGGGYAAIARAAGELTRESGRPGVGMSYAVRQLVGRFFIAENGTDAQRAAWLPRLAAGDMPTSIAISEPNAGAHPKLLTTRAVREGDDYRITGEKGWVTNAPVAGLIIVVAIVAEEEGRKRYGAFLVPRETPGLTIKAEPGAGHGAHCPVVLDGVVVPAAAMLQPGGDAYAKLALPFRTLEDSIAVSAQAAAFRWLAARVAPSVPEEAHGDLGAIVGLISLMERGAEAAAAALDAGGGHDTASLVGVKILAEDVAARIRALPGGGAEEAEAARLLGELDAMHNVARRARQAYQARLGAALLASGKAAAA